MARRGRFIAPTADLSAPWDSQINLLHPISAPAGWQEYFVAPHYRVPGGTK